MVTAILKKGAFMRYPLWILNNILSAVLIASIFLVAIALRRPLPRIVSINPDYEYIPPHNTFVPDIHKIYENDLFGTYRPHEQKLHEKNLVKPVPPPPAPSVVHAKTEPPQSFLPELSIDLRGIMYSSNDTHNIVIIAEKSSSIEKSYKVGDSIEDARIIRIFSNKVLFVRSNGAQETHYLNEQESQKDPTYNTLNSNWKRVVQKLHDTQYLVDPSEFRETVINVAQLIDMLNLMTVYNNGQSIGCRIGSTESGSLGQALGLQQGDILLTIDNMSVSGTSERYAIYKSVIGKNLGDTISVALHRKGAPLTIEYKLHELFVHHKDKSKANTAPPDHLTKEKVATMEQRYAFAPTVEEIAIREKRNMLKKGNRDVQKQLHDHFE